MPFLILPAVLSKCAKNQRVLEFEANTLQALKSAIQKKLPDLYTALCKEDGQFKEFICCYLNNKQIIKGGIGNIPLSDNDQLDIVVAMSGG